MAKAAKKAPARKTKPQAKKAAKTSTPKAPATKAPAPKAIDKATSKAATIIGMLTRSSGATITELTEATGWQAHSVHGFLSGTLRKKQEMEIGSERVDGVRRYRQRLNDGTAQTISACHECRGQAGAALQPEP